MFFLLFLKKLCVLRVWDLSNLGRIFSKTLQKLFKKISLVCPIVTQIDIILVWLKPSVTLDSTKFMGFSSCRENVLNYPLTAETGVQFPYELLPLSPYGVRLCEFGENSHVLFFKIFFKIIIFYVGKCGGYWCFYLAFLIVFRLKHYAKYLRIFITFFCIITKLCRFWSHMLKGSKLLRWLIIFSPYSYAFFICAYN